jgi:hypothetical protein
MPRTLRAFDTVAHSVRNVASPPRLVKNMPRPRSGLGRRWGRRRNPACSAFTRSAFAWAAGKKSKTPWKSHAFHLACFAAPNKGFSLVAEVINPVEPLFTCLHIDINLRPSVHPERTVFWRFEIDSFSYLKPLETP